MHEHIFPAIIRRDESEALHTVEPLHLRREAKRRLVNWERKNSLAGTKYQIVLSDEATRRLAVAAVAAASPWTPHARTNTPSTPSPRPVPRASVAVASSARNRPESQTAMTQWLTRFDALRRASTRLRPALARDYVQEKFTHRPRRPRGVERHRATPARRAMARGGATVRS